jgi:phage terminase small subunit
MRKLTPKQRRFVKYYLESDNATQAVIKAGYDLGGKHGTNTPELTAAAIGSENLTKPNIIEAIDNAMIRQKITPEYVLSGISKLAEGSEKDSDRIRSYELLGKYLKLFQIDQEHSTPTKIVLNLGLPTDTPPLLEGSTEAQIVTDKD